MQADDVYVRSEAGDTGPIPTVPTSWAILLEIASGWRYPADLRDRSTWFVADQVLN
ncbi:MAG: hypothetical protein ACR2LI_14825 [Propionibacteriaceae bacterium]